jgi:hypothetical protein
MINPLRLGLRDYADSLREMFATTDVALTLVEAENTERLEKGSIVGRLIAGFRYYRKCKRFIDSNDVQHIFVCWPLLGNLDFFAWAWIGRRAESIRIVIHDLKPPGDFRKLKRFGYLPTGTGSQWLAQRLCPKIIVIGHTRDGLETLQSRGWQNVEYLPHPVGNVSEVFHQSRGSRRILLVAGQYKPIRDLGVMEDLAQKSQSMDIDLMIVGKGWPVVDGWNMSNRWMPEAEFRDTLAMSSAVLIPYSEYSQSGVSVRALTVGTPAIGVDHPQLQEMYGENYVGVVPLLSATEILEAFARVTQVPKQRWLEIAQDYQISTSAIWSLLFA